MANRFVDTDIWKKPWYRKLSPKHKCLFKYIVDNCNHAGLLDVDYDLMAFMIGDSISEDDLSVLDFLYIWIEDDKVFIPSYIEYQYKVASPECLDPKNNAHKGVISQLSKYSKTKGLIRGLIASQDTEQDKDKDKDKAKPKKDVDVRDYFLEKGFGLETANLEAEKFLNHFEKVGWVTGKNKTKVKDWKACVRTWISNMRK